MISTRPVRPKHLRTQYAGAQGFDSPVIPEERSRTEERVDDKHNGATSQSGIRGISLIEGHKAVTVKS